MLVLIILLVIACRASDLRIVCLCSMCKIDPRLLMMLTLFFNYEFVNSKQAQVTMCLYNRLLGLNKSTRCKNITSLSYELDEPVKRLHTPIKMHSHVAMDDRNSNNTEIAKNKLPRCSSNSAMIICTKDVANECPEGGERSQVCTLSDRSRCCQNVLQGIPVSYINAKLGDCPPPIGISGSQLGIENNCWLDSNCPGIQKCCLEPNPVDQHSNRICRDPVGISRKLGSSVCNLPLAVGSCDSPVQRYYYDASSGLCKTFQFSGCNGNMNNFMSLSSCQATCSHLGIQGTPLCPADANAAIACGVPHADSCQTDEDCLGRQNLKSPTCCMSRCGYRLCYLY